MRLQKRSVPFFKIRVLLERFWRIIDAFLTGFVANEAEALNALENEGGTIPEDLPEWAKKTG